LKEMNKRIAVIGVGNILLGDEGAGVAVIDELDRRGRAGPGNESVELIDAGTAFLAIVHDLKNFDKLIIVDTVRGGKPPGTVYRFGMNDVRNEDMLISLHDIGVVDSIRLERLVGRVPEDIIFYGIEPERIEPSLELSPAVGERIGYAADRIQEEIREA